MLRLAPLGVMSAALLLGAICHARDLQLHYDAQVAWLRAGTLDLSVKRDGDRYELAGMVATSGVMNRFLRWQGRFAATGRFVAGFPRTDAYLLLEDDGETREVLLAFKDKTTIHATDRDSEEVQRPRGSDLMSVTFLAPHCLDDGTVVHDGEDVYRIERLGGERPRIDGADIDDFSRDKLDTAGRRTASPSRRHDARELPSRVTKRCDYRFQGAGQRTRRMSLWVADIDGLEVPVRLQVRVPLFPDGVLRLRRLQLDP